MTDTPKWTGFRPEDYGFPGMSAFPTPPNFALGQRVVVEMAQFWSTQTRAYVEHMTALASCRDPAALMEAQMSYLQRAQAAFAAEGEVIKQLLKTDG